MEDFDSKAVLNPENSFPVSHNPEEVSGAVVPPLHTSQRERAEDYGSVIVRLGDRHRVIECSGGIQWIVQRKRGQQWHGLSYHLNRDVLIEHCKRHGAGEDAIATLQALPTRPGYVEEASSTSTESFLVRNPDWEGLCARPSKIRTTP